MTDASNWRDVVHIMKTPSRSWITGQEDGGFIERIMVPLDEYQMGNLIDAISQVQDTGDWYGEFCDIVARAMRVGGIKQLSSNNGRTFSLDQIERRNVQSNDQKMKGCVSKPDEHGLTNSSLSLRQPR